MVEKKKINRRVTTLAFGLLISPFSLYKRLNANGYATSYRIADHKDYTRIVFELSEKKQFSLFQLSEPLRIVIDIEEIFWNINDRDNLELQSKLISKLRYGLFKPGKSRVVLDLSKPSNIIRAFYLKPNSLYKWRFVVDISQVSLDDYLSNLGNEKKWFFSNNKTDQLLSSKVSKENINQDISNKYNLPIPRKKPALEPSKRKPVIVIDAGHGGVDPGAIGVSGVREKDITLAAALELEKALKRTRKYDVVMTRRKDISMGLRQRIIVARRAAADVFISLHADSIKKPNIRGLSVYTLSENASDREASNLAERENKSDLIIGMDLTNETNDVRNILIDLAQRESMNLAVKISEKLINELKRRVKLLRNTHRFAGFVVLKAPDVPSLLLEMGYLSNRDEERSLRQKKYRKKLVSAIVVAFNNHFYNDT